MPKVEITITAENEFSPELDFDHSVRGFNVSVIGTFVGTVTVQRSLDSGSTFHDVKQYVTPIQEIGDYVERGIKYRIGVKTGDFTSGSIDARLSY